MQSANSAELRKMAALHPESISDDELLSLLSEPADKQAQDFLFGEFYRRFHPRVTNWCFRLTHSRTRAHDLAQEVFFKAWRHIATFRGDSRPSTWLYVITRNHCLSAVQRLASDPLESGAQLPERLRDTSMPHPDRHIERNQLCRDVFQLMTAALDPIEARILTLHYGYEVPLGTITTRMALGNPSGAKAYIVNGRRKLKGALQRRARLAGRANVPEPGLQGGMLHRNTA
jgi:RNA polymerase sigma factor (sigma-70 family)